jgi:uncharacterized protein (DUF697 family)
MSNAPQDAFFTDLVNSAIAAAVDASRHLSQTAQEASKVFETSVGEKLHRTVVDGTEIVGRVVTPIAENPMVRYATKMPGMSWLMAALGQVDIDQVQREVAELRRQYPNDSPAELAQQVMVESAWTAAQVGLVSNFIPPLAFLTAALDIGAVAALQAKMIYRIAAIYGFSPTEPARRGEVLAIWGLSSGTSSVLKSGFSIVELLPGIGAAVGVTTDAALLYGVGQLARQYYETRLKGGTATVETVENVPTKVEID